MSESVVSRPVSTFSGFTSRTQSVVSESVVSESVVSESVVSRPVSTFSGFTSRTQLALINDSTLVVW